MKSLNPQCPSRQTFFEVFWDSQPCHIDLLSLAISEKVNDEIRWLERLNFSDFLELSAGDKIVSWFFKSDSPNSSRYIKKAEAENCFSDLATLYFHVDDSFLPTIRAYITDCFGDIPFKLSILISPRGSWVARHFDGNNNFTLQLKGKKQWTYSPNQKIRLPTKNWVPDTPINSEILLYSPRFISQFECTSEVAETILTESDLFYMPRGYWHATNTLEDSFSLNICIPAVTKARVLCNHLYQHLIRDISWREHIPVSAEEPWDKSELSSIHYQEVLEGIALSLKEINSPIFMIKPPETNTRGFRLSPETKLNKPSLSRFIVYDVNASSGSVDVIFFASDHSEMSLVLCSSLLAVLRIIDQSSLPTLEVKDLFVPNCSPQEVLEFLNILIEFGYIIISSSVQH